jgi:KDO2-lipid IV(A) lauroyltransferase
MSKKSRSAALDYAVYLAVRLVVCVVQALPEELAWSFGRGLGWLAHRVDRRHRQVAFDNLRHAYPELTDAARARLVRRTYAHFGLMLIEMILMPRKLNARNLYDYIAYPRADDFRRVVELAESGKPLIVATGHFGSWEVLSYVIALAGYRGSVIARRLDNPYLDRYLRQFRGRTGQVVLDKNDDYAAIQATLANCRPLGIVGDQDAGQRGVFVEFFGRPASTFKSLALLALEYDATVMVFGACRRGRPLAYDLRLADVIEPGEFARDRDPVRRITERYTRALEWLVRHAPEQYFWLHRRWKHQPVERGKRKAA